MTLATSSSCWQTRTFRSKRFISSSYWGYIFQLYMMSKWVI
jgi:hypothetical protein